MLGGLAPGRRVASALLVCALGCQVRGLIGSNIGTSQDTDAATDDGSATTTGSPPADTGDGDGDGPIDVTLSASSGAADGTTDQTVFDVGAMGDAPNFCPAAAPMSCDADSDDPWHALGINCPGGGPQLDGSLGGSPLAVHVQHGVLGTHGYFAPREGQRMVILSSGLAAEIPLPREALCDFCPSTDLAQPVYNVLPPPIDVRKVDDVLTCVDDPTLVGSGDCSNTIEDEWSAGSGAHDYVEMRMVAEVPPGFDSFRYMFAFFSSEYPLWYNHESPFNDMYIAWLESETWTGNVSFDDEGNPISINGALLDFMDAPAEGCPPPCEAPQLEGFSMEGHAGTRWLETTAPVMSGETIEVVFALFDLSDGIFDSAVVLDDWDWTCGGEPPVTIPAG